MIGGRRHHRHAYVAERHLDAAAEGRDLRVKQSLERLGRQRPAAREAHTEELAAAVHKRVEDGDAAEETDRLRRMDRRPPDLFLMQRFGTVGGFDVGSCIGDHADSSRRRSTCAVSLVEVRGHDLSWKFLIPHDACAVHAALVSCCEHERCDDWNRT